MKKLIEEAEARLTSAETESIWRSIAPAGRRRAALAWLRPLAAAALLLLVVLAVSRWRSAHSPAAPSLAGRADAPEVSAVDPETPRAETVPPAPSASRASVPPDAPAAPVDTARVDTLRAAPPAPRPLHGLMCGRITRLDGTPEAFATVLLLDTSLGAQTDADGRYVVAHVPPGHYRVKVVKMGFDAVTDSTDVPAGGVDTLDFALAEATVAMIHEIQVSGAMPTVTQNTSSTRQSVSREALGALPVDNLTEALSLEAGARSGGGELHFRGGRSGEVHYRGDGAPVGSGASTAPGEPVQSDTWSHVNPARDTRVLPNSVGGTTPVNGEAFDAMFFEHYGVNPFEDPRDDRFATFALDVDNASYALTRAYLEGGELPPPAAVRVEEFVNALDPGYPPPDDRAEAGEEPPALAVRLDAAPSPFGAGLVLLRVGIKAREVPKAGRKPAVLTFVIDVSGSMNERGRMQTVRSALHVLLDGLKDDDRVGMVVFNDQARVVLPPLARRDRGRIEAAIDALSPDGSTNTEAGLVEGYAMAEGAFHEGWINRVILCTDGVANVGQTGAESIHARIAAQAKRGIELTAIGVGLGNYNDVLLEKLADSADGNYYYVDTAREAARVFGDRLVGTLQTVARQAKVQVEFDPARVRRYRLLGYENRAVADTDFRNDSVDAGEVGAGHAVTALFELALENADGAAADTLATVRLRYESAETKRVHELAVGLQRGQVAADIERASPEFRLTAAVAEFAELLRDSYWARGGRLSAAADLARRACRALPDTPARRDILALIETAARLQSNRELDARRFEDVRPRWEPDATHR